MAENKHTPGPWSARKAAHGPIDILAADGRDIVTLYGGGVDEAPADNARLIAAAPELMEALKGAVGALEFSRDFHADLSNLEQAFSQDRLDAALAAIAKAEGRS